MGEAKNPGPGPAAYNPYSTSQPGTTHQAGGGNMKEPAGWRGTWAVPQAFAGEFAKGIYPGPKTSSAGVGPVPHHNTGWNTFLPAMRTHHMSSAGTAQHTQGGKGGHTFWGGQWPAQHYTPPLYGQWWTPSPTTFAAQAPPQTWGGRGRGVPQPRMAEAPQGRGEKDCWYGTGCWRRDCPHRHPGEEQRATGGEGTKGGKGRGKGQHWEPHRPQQPQQARQGNKGWQGGSGAGGQALGFPCFDN